MKKVYVLIPIIFIIFLSIGFSAFTNNLLIDDLGVVVRPISDIRVTGVNYSTNENGGVSNNIDYNIHNINGSVTLPSSNSSVTYTVVITNIGNVKKGISSISLPSNLDYDISGYTVGNKLCDDSNSSNCTNGSVTTIYLTIKYKSGQTVSNNPISFVADFDFEDYYDIQYLGFASVVGLESGIMAGESRNITFTSTTGIPYAVDINGASGNYNNPTLVVSNPTGNITISRKYSVAYSGFSGNTASLPSSIIYSGGTITFNNTSGIPGSVSVTGASFEYSGGPNIVLSNITGNIIITVASGNVEVIDNGDGTITTIIENTVDNGDGSETTTTELINKDSAGNTISTSTTVSTENADGSGTATTTNYDSSGSPTTGSTSITDSSGNVNTQEVEYDSNGNTSVSGYVIDTSNNNDGGEIVASLDTGMIVFDGRGFEMTLVFKCNMSQNIGNNIFGAIQKVNNKYAGFNLAIPSSAKVNMYAGKNSSLYSSGAIGSNIHSGGQYWSISSSNNASVTQYTLTMTYLPKNYGANTNTKYGMVTVSLTPVQTSGSTYYQTNPFTKVSSSIPENLENATFTLGGNGINSSYDMVNFEVVSFEVHKI